MKKVNLSILLILLISILSCNKKKSNPQSVQSSNGTIEFYANGTYYNFVVPEPNGFKPTIGGNLPCSITTIQKALICSDQTFNTFIQIYLNIDSLATNLTYQGDSIICDNKYSIVEIIPIINNKIYNVGAFDARTKLNFSSFSNGKVNGTFELTHYTFGFLDTMVITNGSFHDIPFSYQ